MNEITLQINIEHNHPDPQWIKEKAINTIANRLYSLLQDMQRIGLVLEYDIITPNTGLEALAAKILLKEETEQ